jgi:hypothetical protein
MEDSEYKGVRIINNKGTYHVAGQYFLGGYVNPEATHGMIDYYLSHEYEIVNKKLLTKNYAEFERRIIEFNNKKYMNV